MIRSVVFIGAGNLATHLALAMQESGFAIRQVYSYSEASAATLAGRLGCNYTNNLGEINPSADLYIFAVKDSVLTQVVEAMPPTTGIWAHTAGSMPLELFAMHHDQYGVFYPLQTFSKERAVNFSVIPIFVEGCREAVCEALYQAATILTHRVYKASSQQRQYLHVAAVFACNFSNHLYDIAARLLAENNLPFDALLPLIEESAAKLHTISPREAQTGPAVRYDLNVMEKQLALLPKAELQEIYQLMSKQIHRYNQQTDL